ncbi:MAG: ribosome maturation factor RimP [Methylococcales bacterium]|jgi:ribosome maturation factor RimP|nr:ribosome maturation factor RimP [Methylococcaceae bacterium]HIL39318.1 ribosome maturation factor RimP [Methylococcales bacterium]
MKQAPKHLIELIEPIVEGMGYECVGIEFNPHPTNGLLRIYIDAESGVVLDDCTRVSRQVSGVLDVEDPIKTVYQLEVSSPGAERPLFKVEHFQRFIGQKVQVNLFVPIEKRRNIIGSITSVNDAVIVIDGEDQQFEIPFKSISKANLVADFSI